jgi:hypothetical protein
MRTRRCLGSMALMLVLATSGAVWAQAKAGDRKDEGAGQEPQERAPVEKAQAEGQPPAGSGAKAKAAKAQTKAETKAEKPSAAPSAAGKSGSEAKQAEQPAAAAEAAAGAQPPESGPEAAAAQAPAPAPEGEREFFHHGHEPYRFLQRSEGRYFPEQRTEARPRGPAPRIEPGPPRKRGDAGSAIAIGLALEQDWNLDEGYDLFGEDDVAQNFSLWFSHDLLSLGERTVLAGEIGVGSGTDKASGEFDSMETALQNTRLHLAAYLRYAVWPVLQPHLRLAADASFVKAELDFADDEHFSDRDFSGGGSLGAGLTVRTPTRLFENRKGEFASLSIGLLFEGGYLLASPVSFDLVDDQQADRIEVRTPPLGKLELSGPYFRSSLVVRF